MKEDKLIEKIVEEVLKRFNLKADKVETKTEIANIKNEHIKNFDNPHKLTKAQIGLGNVDNTSDADKPISNATNEVLIRIQSDLTQFSNYNTQAITAHINDFYNPHNVTSSQIGLGLIENHSMDNTPTDNSNNYVTSGGVKKYVDEEAGERIYGISIDGIELPVNGTSIRIVNGKKYKFINLPKYPTKYDLGINSIEALIPEEATYVNQLADKEFVNSSIATATATFRGVVNSIAELPSSGVDLNDYAYVESFDNDGNRLYSRYKYDGSQWKLEYILNNSGFTASEFAAIRSGITEAKRELYDNHLSNYNNPHGVTATQLGLGNVDNTSDKDKPVSDATLIQLNYKETWLNKTSNIRPISASEPALQADNEKYPTEYAVRYELDKKVNINHEFDLYDKSYVGYIDNGVSNILNLGIKTNDGYGTTKTKINFGLDNIIFGIGSNELGLQSIWNNFWNPATTYYENDIVIYNNKMYRAVDWYNHVNLNQTPGLDTSKCWKQINNLDYIPVTTPTDNQSLNQTVHGNYSINVAQNSESAGGNFTIYSYSQMAFQAGTLNSDIYQADMLFEVPKGNFEFYINSNYGFKIYESPDYISSPLFEVNANYIKYKNIDIIGKINTLQENIEGSNIDLISDNELDSIFPDLEAQV